MGMLCVVSQVNVSQSTHIQIGILCFCLFRSVTPWLIIRYKVRDANQ